ALGTQGHLHRIGENVDAAQHALAGSASEADFFRCHSVAPLAVNGLFGKAGKGRLLELHTYLRTCPWPADYHVSNIAGMPSALLRWNVVVSNFRSSWRARCQERLSSV